MTFTEQFLAEAAEILKQIDVAAVERLAATLAACRAGGGRLFILGVGGSAANASHAVNDFRKICGLEAYAPTDNVSELTARTNDEGWAGVFEGWLRVSRLGAADALLIFSAGLACVGGVRILSFGGAPTDAWWNIPLTILWLLACMNAFNLVDGLDGLAVGVGLFATLTVFTAAMMQHNMVLAVATFPLAGALL